MQEQEHAHTQSRREPQPPSEAKAPGGAGGEAPAHAERSEGVQHDEGEAVRAFRGHTSPLAFVDLRGSSYNTDALVRGLERLFERLPEQTAESEPPSATQRTRTAKQLKSGEIDELIAGYEAGATLEELGARFGIHPATAGLILKRNGVQLGPRSLTDDQVREATRLCSSGWSSARIGDRLGFNGTTIITALRRCGVMIRDSHGQPGRR